MPDAAPQAAYRTRLPVAFRILLPLTVRRVPDAVRSVSALVALPRLPIELRIAIAAISFRVIGAFVGFIANLTIPDYQNQGFTVMAEPNAFWDRFARYDAGWYYGIAARGYAFVEGGRSNLAFFPLYPKLMGIGGQWLGGAQHHYYIAGIVV